jgi:two-component system OmpR family response regulator
MEKKRVLVVDDDPMVLEMVKDHLSEMGFEVHTYDRALGTSNEVMRVKADLLILDIDMPALKGDKICEIIRKEGYFPDLKILFYSVLDERELAKMAKEQGADDYLSKSDDLTALGIKVKRLLTGH